MQHIEPLVGMPTSSTGMAVQAPTTALSMQLPANVPWEAADHGPRAWGPVTHVRDWLWPGPVLAVAGI